MDLRGVALSAARFADLLTSCGIPAKRHDVENAAKREFVPNLVPRTLRCLEALKQVGQHFPSVRIEEFLAAEEDALFPFVALHHDKGARGARIGRHRRYTLFAKETSIAPAGPTNRRFMGAPNSLYISPLTEFWGIVPTDRSNRDSKHVEHLIKPRHDLNLWGM